MTRPLLRPTPIPLLLGASVLALLIVGSGEVVALAVMARSAALRPVNDGIAATCPVVAASHPERP